MLAFGGDSFVLDHAENEESPSTPVADQCPAGAGSPSEQGGVSGASPIIASNEIALIQFELEMELFTNSFLHWPESPLYDLLKVPRRAVVLDCHFS